MQGSYGGCYNRQSEDGREGGCLGGLRRPPRENFQLALDVQYISELRGVGPPVLAMTGCRKVVWRPVVAAAAAVVVVLMCGVPGTRAAISDRGIEVRVLSPPRRILDL